MDPVVTGGVIGIGGTLLGVAAQEGLASWREYRQKQRRLLIAMTGIFNKALERGAWWNEGDEPRDDQWQQSRSVLTEALSEDLILRTTWAYESVRSLAATRSSPLTPLGKPESPLAEMIGAGHSFFSLIWTEDRWPDAAAEVEQVRRDIGALVSDEGLRPIHTRLREKADSRGRLLRSADRWIAHIPGT